MLKPKTPQIGRLENSSGEWIRTTDLRVMRGNLRPVTEERIPALKSCMGYKPFHFYQILHCLKFRIASKNNSTLTDC
jgi:hypothetical protein